MTLEKMTSLALPKAVLATAVVATDSAFSKFCAAHSVTCGVLGSFQKGVWLLFCMMGLDLISGVMAARAKREVITSRRFGAGMGRKIGMFLVVAGAFLLEEVFRDNSVDLHGLLVKWTVTWFIATEALSLYENAHALGLPMPKVMKSAIDWLLQH